MAQTTRRRRRRTRKVEEPEPEEVEVEEVVEEEAPKPKYTRRTRKKVEEPEPEEPEDVEEDEPEPAPKKRTTTRRRTRKKVEEPEPEEPEDVEEDDGPAEESILPATLSKLLNDKFFSDLLQAMEEGTAITIVRKSAEEWVLGATASELVSTVTKLRGKAYDQEVQSVEYQEHYQEWKELSDEEKYEIIDDAGVEWEEHDNPKINIMRATTVYREYLGIEKYKPEYRDPAARMAIRAR